MRFVRCSARWRQYKYFFWDDGLDLVAMRDAASRLVVRGMRSATILDGKTRAAQRRTQSHSFSDAESEGESE